MPEKEVMMRELGAAAYMVYLPESFLYVPENYLAKYNEVIPAIIASTIANLENEIRIPRQSTTRPGMTFTPPTILERWYARHNTGQRDRAEAIFWRTVGGVNRGTGHLISDGIIKDIFLKNYANLDEWGIPHG